MDPRPFQVLEAVVDRGLADLPAPRAPRTLLPRVMAAVRAGVNRAPLVDWRAWPPVWRMAAVAGLLLVGLGAATVAQFGVDLAGWLVASQPIDSPNLRVLHELATWTAALRVIWRVIEPLVILAGAVVAVMAATCVAFGSALGRLAPGGAFRP